MYAPLFSLYRYNLVKSLYFLNPKFQASSHLLWLYTTRFVSDLVRNHKTGSHDTAHTCILHKYDSCNALPLLKMSPGSSFTNWARDIVIMTLPVIIIRQDWTRTDICKPTKQNKITSKSKCIVNYNSLCQVSVHRSINGEYETYFTAQFR